MKHFKISFLILSSLYLSACGLQEYKASNPDAMGTYGLEGYLDKKLSEDTYMIEYFGDPGYVKIDHVQLMGYAKQRAAELCPNGYTDELKIIEMQNAYFKAFQCFSMGCARAKVVASGIVTCSK